MRNKLLAAAAVAAMVTAIVPAQAAKMGIGCNGSNLAKTESGIDTMADGPAKLEAEKEMAMAQDAMLNGKMSACSMHLTKIMHTEAGK